VRQASSRRQVAGGRVRNEQRQDHRQRRMEGRLGRPKRHNTTPTDEGDNDRPRSDRQQRRETTTAQPQPDSPGWIRRRKTRRRRRLHRCRRRWPHASEEEEALTGITRRPFTAIKAHRKAVSVAIGSPTPAPRPAGMTLAIQKTPARPCRRSAADIWKRSGAAARRDDQPVISFVNFQAPKRKNHPVSRPVVTHSRMGPI